MNKIFALFFIVFLFFSCDPAVGTISEQDFVTAKYIVDGVERDLKFGYGLNYNRNFYSINTDIDEHALIVSLCIERIKLCKDCHINLIVSDKLEYDNLEVIEGTAIDINGGKGIESISSTDGYDSIKIKFLWKDNFTSLNEIYVVFTDNNNKKQSSPIAFELDNSKFI